MTRRHFVRTVNDLKGVAAPIIAVLLVLTACVVLVVGLLRDVRIDTLLAVLGALLSPATALLVDPGRHGRATDPDPADGP